MAFEIKKAEQVVKPLKLALQGPAGSGKTDGAIATAIRMGFKNIVVIDTEHGSSANYAKKYKGKYNVLPFEAPYTSARYVEAMNAAKNFGADCVIIDSISHQWDGQDGILERKEKEQKSKPNANGYTLWAAYTAEHKKFVEFMLAFPIPIFATMRSKTAYVMSEGSNGKQIPKKMGMEPIQREGVDYEFDVVVEINIAHSAEVTKDRTGVLADKQFDLVGSDEFVKIVTAWQKDGSVPATPPTVGTPAPVAEPPKADPPKTRGKAKNEPPPKAEPDLGFDDEGGDELPAKPTPEAPKTTAPWTPDGWKTMTGVDKLNTICAHFAEFYQQEDLDDLETAQARTKELRDEHIALLKPRFTAEMSQDRKKEMIAEEILKVYRDKAKK